MKEKIEFDKNIADRINNYESTVNPLMWERINQGLDESPKRVIPFWLLFGAIAFVSLVGISSYYYLQSDIGHTSTNVSAQSSEMESQEIPSIETANAIDTKELIHQINKEEKLPAKNENVASSIKNEKTIVATEAIIPSNSNYIPSKTKSVITTNETSQNIFRNSASEFQTSRLLNATTVSAKVANELTPELELNASSSTLTKETATGLSYARLNTLDLPFKVQWEAPFKDPDPSGCYNFGKNNSLRYLLDLYIAPQYSFRSLEDPTGTMSDHISARDSTEKSLFAYTIGGRASVAMSNGLAFRAGLSYTEIQERFDLDIANEMKTIIEIDVITNGMGDTTRIDTTTFIQTGTRKIRRFNYLRSFDVPVMLGYGFDVGNLALEFNAGAIFNIHFRSRGTFLSPFTGGHIASYTKGDPEYIDAFKTNIGVSYYGSAAVSIPLNPKFDFLIEPHVRYTPNSITKATYAVNQKHLLTGVAFVLRYKL